MNYRTVHVWLAVALLAMSANAAAQTIDEIEVLPDFMLRRILTDPYEEASNKLIEEGRIEQGVLSGAKQWSGSEPIRVCFFGGMPELRRRIVSVASAWELPGSTIKFDFGDRTNPRLCGGRKNYDIRVGYSLPGYWSFVGQDSLVYAQQTEQSLNLGRFDVATIADGIEMPSLWRIDLGPPHEIYAGLGRHRDLLDRRTRRKCQKHENRGSEKLHCPTCPMAEPGRSMMYPAPRSYATHPLANHRERTERGGGRQRKRRSPDKRQPFYEHQLAA